MSIRPKPWFVPPLEETLVRLLRVPSHPESDFDEADFLDVLAATPSLSFEEKVGIVAGVSDLSQEQINALFDILEDEAERLAELQVRVYAAARDEIHARDARRAFVLIDGGQRD